jgi:bacteriocin biosynthesis cyclodehydratase domain-containing protein
MLDEHLKLKALPAQLISIPNGTIVKRGCSEMRIDGAGCFEVLQRILVIAASPVTADEIRLYFPENYKTAVLRLIEFLKARRVLVPADAAPVTDELEQPSDIFYWHFQSSEPETTVRLQKYNVVLMGVNSITQRLVLSLRTAGFTQVQLIDWPLLRGCHVTGSQRSLKQDVWNDDSTNPVSYEQWLETLKDRSLDCLVSASDFGGSVLMAEWNAFCYERKCHFFPIVLQNLIGYMGPLVIPGETPCYECLIARENSHSQDWRIDRAIERSAPDGKGIIGFHPLMSSVVADVAAFELAKFYSGQLPQRCVGRLIELNLLAAKMTSRKILKVPRCHCCSELNIRSSISHYKDLSAESEKMGDARN